MLNKLTIQKWLEKEGSAYSFLAMYALLFIVFIIVPVLVAFLLSFTFFDKSCRNSRVQMIPLNLR